MFSMKRRWFVAYRTGLLKARGRRKGQNRFWPVAVEQRQKWAGCNAYVCCLLCSTVSACTRAHARAHSLCQQGKTVCSA